MTPFSLSFLTACQICSADDSRLIPKNRTCNFRNKRLAATKAFILNVCFKRLCQFFPLIADASR